MARKSACATILEIDDEPRESLLEGSQFAALPAERKTAESIGSAQRAIKVLGPLQKFGGTNIVIVLDLMFKRNDPDEGLDFLRRLRGGKLALHPNTPVVVLSNVANPATIASAYAAGANTVFKKTDDPGRLLDALSFYLGKETLSARVTWEIAQLLPNERRARIRTRIGERCIVEKLVDMEMLPSEARFEGGAFYLEAFKVFRDYKTELVLRTSPIEAEDAGTELEALLNPAF